MKYHVEKGDPERDRSRILGLWHRAGFGSDAEECAARYDWFYLHNPAGRGRIYLLLLESGELVGAMGAGTRVFPATPARGQLAGSLLVDFVVEPAHRTMFPALQLQRAAREAELQTHDFFYGFPDAKAVPIFKRMRAHRQIEARDHVRVLRSAKYLAKTLPRLPRWVVSMLAACADRLRVVALRLQTSGCRVRRVPITDAGRTHASLLMEFEGLADLAMGDRSAAFIAWRAAGIRAGEVELYEVDRRGTLQGLFLCCRRAPELQVLDLVISTDSSRAIAGLRTLALEGWRAGLDVVRLSFGGNYAAAGALEAAGYHARGTRSGFLSARSDETAEHLPRDWWFTRGDEDV